MQKTIFATGIILLSTVLFSCRHTEMPQNESDSAAADDIIEWTLGTIKYINLEGGFWAIMGDDETNFAPEAIAEEFCEEGLRVKFTFTDNSGPSFQMWGRRINLVEIEKDSE